MIKGIDHIAIAVADLDEALKTFESVFGLEATHREHIADYDVEVATVKVGNTAIEFIQATSDDSPIRAFVEKRGAGIHHIALAVDDVEAGLESLNKKGVDLIDATPRDGKEGSRVAFVHPRSTSRVLYELVQTRDESEPELK